MKKEIAKKWVRALRSKKYRQVAGALKVKSRAGQTSHCCLGVLCELYQAEQKKAGRPRLKTSDAIAEDIGVVYFPKTSRIFEFGNSMLTLPHAVRRWAGMCDDAGMFRGDEQVTHRGRAYNGLAEMNDSGCKFSTIANVIEEHVADI